MIPAFDINSTVAKAELAILKTLVYFDIFDYPLSDKEIKNFLGLPLDDELFIIVMGQLISDGIVYRVGEFYSLHNNQQKAEKRIQGNRRAQDLLIKADRIGAFLFRFPYVRGVAVSGSLSKNYADKKADIDYFIVTKANRLWIARTILHLYKKFTFLAGREHFYCMNYFIDEKAMVIPEKNIYTAIEVVTLLPVAGNTTMKRFFDSNDWTEAWLPCFEPGERKPRLDKGSALKRFGEWLFAGVSGDKLDNFLFKWTTRRWQKKEERGLRNSKGKIMNLSTGKHFSKSNPEAFQEKILTVFSNKMSGYRKYWPEWFD